MTERISGAPLKNKNQGLSNVYEEGKGMVGGKLNYYDDFSLGSVLWSDYIEFIHYLVST
jgi:hypothetical protein